MAKKVRLTLNSDVGKNDEGILCFFLYKGTETNKLVDGEYKKVTPFSFLAKGFGIGAEHFYYSIDGGLKIDSEYQVAGCKRILVGDMKRTYSRTEDSHTEVLFTTPAWPFLDSYRMIKLVELLPRINGGNIGCIREAENLISNRERLGEKKCLESAKGIRNSFSRFIGKDTENPIPPMFLSVEANKLRKALRSKPENLIGVQNDAEIEVLLEGDLKFLFEEYK